MAKIKKPEIGNPLAGMGLDEIVRNITAPEKLTWKSTKKPPAKLRTHPGKRANPDVAE